MIDLTKEVPSTILDRILARVDKTTYPPDPFRPVSGPCWIWLGGKFPSGYGSISVADQTYLVHRLTYIAFHGPFPADRPFSDHVCRVRACCSPKHVEAVTPTENLIRAQRPYCKWGHAMTPENTGPVKRHPTRRVCRLCSQEKTRRYRGRRRIA